MSRVPLANTYCPMTSWLPPAGSRTSWNYDLTSYEAQRLLNLVEESHIERLTGMSETKMTVVTEATWKSSNPVKPIVTTISRANSDMSLYTPVRRRSVIQTPGIATRSNSARPSSRARNYRHSVPPTPSLSRQHSFESHRSGVSSMPPLPLSLGIGFLDSAPRAVTPREDEYQSIGAFKLGTLRITNGTASPVTSEVENLGRQKAEEERTTTTESVSYFPHEIQDTSLDVVDDYPLPIPEPPSKPAPEIPVSQPLPIQRSPIRASFLDEQLSRGVYLSLSPDSLFHPKPEADYLAEINFSPFSSRLRSHQALSCRRLRSIRLWRISFSRTKHMRRSSSTHLRKF